MAKPKYLEHPGYRCLRVDDVDGYNMAIINHTTVDFSDADLRGIDFRDVDLEKVVLRGAYLRDADLRGCDLRKMDLEGASLHGAKIAGVFFPDNVSAAEIEMSVVHGTRIRTDPKRC
jgi:uncharacterized protein YjbI with pentapeptide repeats